VADPHPCPTLPRSCRGGLAAAARSGHGHADCFANIHTDGHAADRDGDGYAYCHADEDQHAYGDTDPHRDADVDPDRDEHADQDIDAHAYENGHTDRHTHDNPDAHAHGHRHADQDVDTDRDADGDGHADTDSDGNAHTYGDPDVDADAELDADAHTDRHLDSNEDADGDGDPNGDADGYPDAYRDGYEHAVAGGDEHGNGNAIEHAHPASRIMGGRGAAFRLGIGRGARPMGGASQGGAMGGFTMRNALCGIILAALLAPAVVHADNGTLVIQRDERWLWDCDFAPRGAANIATATIAVDVREGVDAGKDSLVSNAAICAGDPKKFCWIFEAAGRTNKARYQIHVNATDVNGHKFSCDGQVIVRDTKL
jgi:hypothetical protein